MTQTLKCKKCGKEIGELEAFPGTICLACHAKAFDASPEEMHRTIVDVFQKGKAINTRRRPR